jgi:glyoxylate/hydroxypyruvate reductase A
MHVYARQQKAQQWGQHENADPAKRRIGFLGLGELAQDAAHAVLMLGFESIASWSRTPKDLPGIESFVGAEGLGAFLARTEILVCLLPHTQHTKGLLNAATLAKLPRGAFVINAGRGSLVVETDMIDALKSGHIEAAAFDVFATEPLPQDHPYWTMDNVFITPHIASLTTAASATQVVAKGIQAITEGDLPDNVVNLKTGY